MHDARQYCPLCRSPNNLHHFSEGRWQSLPRERTSRLSTPTKFLLRYRHRLSIKVLKYPLALGSRSGAEYFPGYLLLKYLLLMLGDVGRPHQRSVSWLDGEQCAHKCFELICPPFARAEVSNMTRYLKWQQHEARIHTLQFLILGLPNLRNLGLPG